MFNDFLCFQKFKITEGTLKDSLTVSKTMILASEFCTLGYDPDLLTKARFFY